VVFEINKYSPDPGARAPLSLYAGALNPFPAFVAFATEKRRAWASKWFVTARQKSLY